MQDAGECSPAYDYSDLAGGILLIAEDERGIVGYARFDLGRPESYVRSVAVAAVARRTRVARRLIAEVWRRAHAFGAQGLQGFASGQEAAALWGSRECARLQSTVRVRAAYADYVRYLRTRADAGEAVAQEVLGWLGEEVAVHA